MERSLDKKEACIVLGVKMRKLEYMLTNREIRCVRLGRRVLFRPEHLSEVMARNEQPALA
jgi:excisionase family DNA binding protein